MAPHGSHGHSTRSSYRRSYFGSTWDNLMKQLRSERRQHYEDPRTSRWSPTYGTYYSHTDQSPPSGSPHRSSSSSTIPTTAADCTCNCCSHECWRHRKSRKNRSGGEGIYAGDKNSLPSSPRQASKSHFEPTGLSGSKSGNRRYPSNKQSTLDTTISVHDHTDGPLRKRHGSIFTLIIPGDASTSDVLDTLTPTGAETVLVFWDKGVREVLDGDVSLRKLRKHASRLEIRKKKHVHWI